MKTKETRYDNHQAIDLILAEKIWHVKLTPWEERKKTRRQLVFEFVKEDYHWGLSSNCVAWSPIKKAFLKKIKEIPPAKEAFHATRSVFEAEWTRDLAEAMQFCSYQAIQSLSWGFGGIKLDSLPLRLSWSSSDMWLPGDIEEFPAQQILDKTFQQQN